MEMAVRRVVEDRWPSRPTSGPLWRDHRVFGPCAPIQHWGEAGGKKAQGSLTGALLAWALEALAGSVAADALYAGSSCGLSAVENRQDKRMVSAGLAHASTPDDRKAFPGRLPTAWDDRDVALTGLTTEGAGLSPAPSRAGFGEGPHQRHRHEAKQSNHFHGQAR